MPTGEGNGDDSNHRLYALEQRLQELESKLGGMNGTHDSSGEVKDLERRVEELSTRLENVIAQSTSKPSGGTANPMSQTNIDVSEHGVARRVEAGRAAVTRRKGGGPTRINFQQRFDRVPHVQITPERFGGTGNFENFWLYLFNDGPPCVDRDGFEVGSYVGVGHTVVFRWLAVEIV
ncbi:hypothetical protein BDV38DRAFT_232050 [Aspergillus pseudotamarii]|uniref:Uncharacterized protein n=1 Tax=Aspergillus pseudotamarii TaxID=132259 RepID=A0A5N6TBM5_ASPPS|nr:uncharacterized protein BDV38DRAFT_232050 [Aspergillus pseudotamarii]KAE8143774.1 hypothetical protein BDV38DRAFT_232050 [Aspergillus pseudotamarii]